MEKAVEKAQGEDLRTLLGNVVHDGRQLVTQQIDLFRAEAGREIRKAGIGAASAAAGGGLLAAGGVLSGLALVRLVHDVTGLPLWACYAAAAGGMGAAGAALLRSGRERLSEVRPLPQSAEALGENLEWLKERLLPTTG